MMNLSEVVSSKVVPLVVVIVLLVIGADVVDSAATRSSTGPTTRGVQQQHGGKPHSGDVWKYVSSLEQSTSRRFDQMESRLTRTLEERIQLVNHTASIEYLEKYMQMLNDQLTEDEEEAKNNQLQMEEMRRQNRLQETTIEELRQKLTGLQETAARLTAAVEECRAKGEAPPPESLMSTGNEDSPPSTASASASVSPTTPKLLPIDCQEAYDNASADQQRGFYNRQIKPRTSDGQFKACCFANQSAEVWTVIQRRFDGSVEFYRSWDEYKEGFGDVAGGEFWLGNDHIYHLTNQGDYRLRIEMRTWDDEFRWAEYRRFRVADETDKYRLRVAGYSGDAGNSLSSAWDNDHNGQQFSTYDADNDDRFYDNCAEHYRGAWWFRSCFRSHLNGVYYPKGDHSNFFVRNGIQWDSIDQHSSLKEVTMMIRANEEAEAEDGEEGEALLSNGIEKDA